MTQRAPHLQKAGLYANVRKMFARPTSEFLLNDLLCQASAAAEPAEQMYWLEQIMHWLFHGNVEHVDARFRFFFAVLDKNPEWQKNFNETFAAILSRYHFVDLFTQIGLAVESGLWGDMVDRLVQKIVPAGGKVGFYEALLNVFRNPAQLDQLRRLSDETLLHLYDLLMFPSVRSAWSAVEHDVSEALLYLATHVAHYGISQQIRHRLPSDEALSDSAFLLLAQSFQTQGPRPSLVLDKCERDIDAVYASMEQSGVSVDVVNRLETIAALLQQIRNLLRLRAPGSKLEKVREVRAFIVTIIESGLRGRSVTDHVRRHFYLLSRKIVERNGQSADHYIARSSPERRRLFRSAIGGGAIVVVMTIFKISLIRASPPLLFLAFGMWAIYALGFLAMQFSGASLATKIPSFTASRLAGLLKTLRKQNKHEFRDEFRLATKSQTIALIGNFVGVIPLALFLDFALKWISGGSGLVDTHYATHTLDDLHPWRSLALPLGALTGVELWMSSLVGGWFENWVVFHRIPSAIENHFRLRQLFGVATAKNLCAWTLKHSSGVATNVSLGFLFAFVPFAGALIGANWSGNHVTISTTSAVFAVSSLNFALSAWDWCMVACGLLMIGTLNFAVSFGLALFVAGNAQKMRFRRVLHYLKSGVAHEPSKI